jgi:hypothetical protein
LIRSSDLWAFAPAGEQVLVARVHGESLRVLAIPLSGGPARQVFSFDAPHGLPIYGVTLAASAQRAVVTVEMGRGVGRALAVQTFAGTVGGGWSELQPFTDLGRSDVFVPVRQQVEGERIFTTESRSDDAMRVVVRDPDPHEVAFAPGEDVLNATFVGDLVASGAGIYGLVVRDWRTGAAVSSARLPDGVDSIALRPDGRAAVTLTAGALYDVRPGARPQPLGYAMEPANIGLTNVPVAWAGDALVYITYGGDFRVIDASGRSRPFGVPTRWIYGFATDGSRVLWVANGCLLVDDVSAPQSTAPGPGPCVRSELEIDNEPPTLARTLPFRLRCVAAPRVCRGTLRLTTRSARAHVISQRLRFAIPAGQARRLEVPLTCRGYRLMRRKLAQAPSARVHLGARTVDGERFPFDPTIDVSSGTGGVMRRC